MSGKVEGLPADLAEAVRLDELAWALSEQAEQAGAERFEDDNSTSWLLRIEHFKALAADAQSVAAGGEAVVTDDMVGAALRVYRDAEADILGTRATPYNGARLQMMRSAIRAALATQHGDNT